MASPCGRRDSILVAECISADGVLPETRTPIHTPRFPQDRAWRPEEGRTRSASALLLSYAPPDARKRLRPRHALAVVRLREAGRDGLRYRLQLDQAFFVALTYAAQRLADLFARRPVQVFFDPAFDKPFQVGLLKHASLLPPVLCLLNRRDWTVIPKARDVGDVEVSPRLSMPH